MRSRHDAKGQRKAELKAINRDEGDKRDKGLKPFKGKTEKALTQRRRGAKKDTTTSWNG